jgi:type VI secretion system protein ImpJ
MSRKPLWTEGLFLSQHHFQAQDFYHELQLRDRIAAIRRFDWGILELEVDDRLLQAGQFRLRRLEAVWPDGMVVRCGGSSENPPPEARSFEAFFTPELSHLDVFVGVPAETGSAANVAAPAESAALRRFSRASRSMADFNTGGAVQDIEVAVPNLRVFFGNEQREKMSALPVAQLIRQPSGRVIVRDNYVPPVLSIAAAPFVTNSLQSVLAEITSVQREQAGKRKQRDEGSIEFHPTDARQFLILHTLNGAIPVLSHLLDTQKAHPEEVYLALTALAGQLCTFAPAKVAEPTSLPRFNYNELGEVFERLFALVRTLLKLIIVVPYAEIPLERRPDGSFVGRISEPRLLNHEFFVAAKSDQPEALMRARVPGLLKIASWTQIQEALQGAGHGVRCEVDFSPSSALPLRPGLCFFRLRREGSYWDGIVQTRTLCLYIPRDTGWTDISLFVYAIDPQYLR